MAASKTSRQTNQWRILWAFGGGLHDAKMCIQYMYSLTHYGMDGRLICNNIVSWMCFAFLIFSSSVQCVINTLIQEDICHHGNMMLHYFRELFSIKQEISPYPPSPQKPKQKNLNQKIFTVYFNLFSFYIFFVLLTCWCRDWTFSVVWKIYAGFLGFISAQNDISRIVSESIIIL